MVEDIDPHIIGLGKIEEGEVDLFYILKNPSRLMK